MRVRWQFNWRWHVWGVAVILKQGCVGVHIGPLEIERVTAEAKSYAMKLEDEIRELRRQLKQAKSGGPAT